MTKFVRLLPILLLASTFAGPSAAARPDGFAYAAFDSLDGYLLRISLDRGVVYVGDAGRTAKQCPQTDEFICLESSVFKFAVPKQPLCPGSSWTKNGLDSKVVGNEKAVVFGRSYDVSVIAQKAGKQEVATYLYSPRSGLVGFAILEKPGKFSPMYLMKGEVGFGAMEGAATDGDVSSGLRHCGPDS